MSLAEIIHARYVHDRRSQILSHQLASILPKNASVLDVGCGDGLITHLICEARPDVRMRGIDVLVRERTHIPTESYDGVTIPYDDASFNAVMFVDVLHHAADPFALLREAKRVTRKTIVIKDHTLEGAFARLTLRYMDEVGNLRHGVRLPHNYWPRQRWSESFDKLQLTIEHWADTLNIYPWPANLIFDRGLHFIARLASN